MHRNTLINTRAGLLAALVLLVTLVPMWGFLLHGLGQERALLNQAARSDAMNLAIAFEAHVRSVIHHVDMVLLRLREDLEQDPEAFERLTGGADLHEGLIAQFSLIDADGRLAKSSLAPVTRPVDLSDREHFRVHRDAPSADRLFISRPVLGRVSGIWSIQFTRPVQRDGAFAGVLVLSVPVAHFSDYYRQINLGANGQIALVGLDRVPRAFASATVNEVSRVIEAVPADRPYLDLARPANGFLEGISAFDGRVRLTAYRRLDGHRLVVLVQLLPEDYLEAFQHHRVLLLWFASIVTVIVAGGVLLGAVLVRRHLLDAVALRDAHALLQRMIGTDTLTGAASRRRFLEALNAEYLRSLRHAEPLALLMLDLDHFKAVNDTYGHPIGDVVLKEFAARCLQELRANDMLGRLGGEEFAVLLPHTDAEGALRVAEKLRARIGEQAMPTPKGEVRITVSIGAALLGGESPEQFISRADTALYAAKQQGRNRVCLAPDHALVLV